MLSVMGLFCFKKILKGLLFVFSVVTTICFNQI